MLYFGYGSNLCSADLDRFCRESGCEPIRLARVGTGFLPDRRLAFTHRSSTRGGGVLDVPDDRGAAVAGVLFRVTGKGAVRALDLKESGGHTYRRIETIALTEDGAEQPVFTYEVEPGSRVPFVEPAEGYLDVVRRGYGEHGIPVEVLNDVARGATHRGPVTKLFVYGTLLAGEERHPLLRRHGIASGEAADVPGALIDLGAYPGLVVDGGKAHVRGELYDVPAAGGLFEELDAVEMFRGYGVPTSTYRRALVTADRPGGGATLAWTYVYNGRRDGARVIRSGDRRLRPRP